jgi:hypothetical protein
MLLRGKKKNTFTFFLGNMDSRGGIKRAIYNCFPGIVS